MHIGVIILLFTMTKSMCLIYDFTRNKSSVAGSFRIVVCCIWTFSKSLNVWN